MTAFQIGISGMMAHQRRMEAVGNNIANVGTIGYRGQQVLFSDSFYTLLQDAQAASGSQPGSDPLLVGSGVTVAGSRTNFAQGGLQSTGRALDVAVSGRGMLAVTDGRQLYYTRDGALGLDAAGNLVHLSSGMKVVALPAGQGASAGVSPTSSVQVPLDQRLSARATSEIRLRGNLDSRTAADASYSVEAQVHDSLGRTHLVTVTFTRGSEPNKWSVTASSSSGGVTVGGPAELSFDADGNPTVAGLSLQFAPTDPQGAAASYNISVSPAGLTQLAGDSTASLAGQDGLPPGALTGVRVDESGALVGLYSNGQRRPLAQLVSALFPNMEGLAPRGGSLFEATANSGAASFGTPGSDGLGEFQSGYLEGSNVNLTAEFAEMISTQRGFQASSRVVSSADEVLRDIINLLR